MVSITRVTSGKHRWRAGACAAALAVLPVAARATENAGTNADLAFIDTLSGVPLPPGFYLREDLNYSQSGRFNDRNGDKLSVNLGVLGRRPVKFYNSVVADVITGFYVPDWKVPYINATIGAGVYQVFAASRAKAAFNVLGQVRGEGETVGGAGNLTVVPLYLGWAFPEANFYVTTAPLDFVAPVGEYNKNDPLGNNIGQNYFSYRPTINLTYLNKTGQELSVALNYEVNFTNPATNYKSGNEFYFNWAAQQHFSTAFAVGVEGYYYKQVQDDRQNGRVVNTGPAPSPFSSADPLNGGPGNRGEVFAAGPVISYDPLPNVFANFHWVHEFFSYNRKQGESFWLRASVRF